ncbi:MAG: glutamine-hydrolyzing carbamoyl-phosphate synthase small subunit [Actinobacteria bacterium]|uniref:carbamoyl-phosphate synthase (glutamine-hydrolyzing) n=1 Tax=freshwater metagenome TaxID=449393 RepID=A0A6J6HVS7_9ZZZZ|nr:glutamine-hydrolyzing carbamoyl-phosphate synthase small subunit [Actinomycetota bacterium]
MNTTTAKLVLEDGMIFEGLAYGAEGQTLGEIVFATGMTGYQETITDPSYAGQIVVQTSPHIGITGVNTRDEESNRIWVSGYVVREPSRVVSNHRSERSLDEELEDNFVVGISGIDTRALTRHIRSRGAMRAGIFSGPRSEQAVERLVEIVREAPEMKGQSLSSVVTTPDAYEVPHMGQFVGRVSILDLGIKRSTIEHMIKRGLVVTVLPALTSLETLLATKPDAVFFSNGPGDPGASVDQVELLKEVLERRIPFFGICFGNQLLGRALGFETYKLAFGHRGINQPILDRATGRVEVTAHNHGFAVHVPGGEAGEIVSSPAGFGRVRVSHVNLNDDCVEGLECIDVPAFSVQYHPEAAAGPHDSSYLFDRLVDMIKSRGDN